MCYKCACKGKSSIVVVQRKAKIWLDDDYGRPVLVTKRPMDLKPAKQKVIKLRQKHDAKRRITMEIITVTKQVINVHGYGDERAPHMGRAEKKILQEMRRLQEKLESLNKKGLRRKGKVPPKVA